MTSLYIGSPSAPGSLVRSSTAIFFTLCGKHAANQLFADEWADTGEP
jgi:hypothetical protein